MSVKEFTARNGGIINDKLAVLTGANTYFTANALGTFIGSVVVSNTNINVGSNVFLSSAALFIGNSTSNVVANSSTLFISASINVGTTVVNTSHVFLGNSTVNSTSNNTTFRISNATSFTYQHALSYHSQATASSAERTYWNHSQFIMGNTTFNAVVLTNTNLLFTNGTVNSNYGFAFANVGANVRLSTSELSIGNTTVNATVNSIQIAILGAAVNTNINTTAIALANSTQSATLAPGSINVTSSVNVGANVSLSTVAFLVGNSTVNSFSNSTAHVVQSAAAVATLLSTSISIGANVSLTLSTLNIGNTTVNSVAAISGTTYSNSTLTTIYGLGSANVGANVSLSPSQLFVGNTTVNCIVNSSAITINGTNRSGFGNTTFAGLVELAVNTEFLSGSSANLALTPNAVYSSAALTTLTDGASITPDLNTGINFTVTLGGNRTLAAMTNTLPGKAGMIRVVQDGTGSRTLSYNSVYKWAGGTVGVLSTAINAIDYLDYFVANSTHIRLSLSKAWA